MKFNNLIALFLILVFSTLQVFEAQEDDILNELFGEGTSLIDTTDETKESVSIESEEGFNWSGQLSFGVNYGGYYSLEDEKFHTNNRNYSNDLNYLLARSFSGNLAFSATNQEGVDFYGKFNLTPDSKELFTLNTLYTKFDIENEFFIKAGKYSVNWGVGTFFRPTDVVNLTTINPHDDSSTADDIEGPVNVKFSMPVGSLNYLAAYGIVGNSLHDSGGALKFDYVLGNYELSLGGFYRNGEPVSAVATITGSLFNINLYGGFTGSYNLSSSVFSPHATAGGSYSFNDDEGLFNISLAGQYYYDGENNDHNIGSSVSWNGLLGSSLNFTTIYTANILDSAHYITPRLSYSFDYPISLSLSLPITVNDAVLGDTIGAKVSLSIGGGKF